ncbi:hypothetical protein ACIRL2_29195 [Embleya sp. NPDC127516]|uniref:hypothetical protein n=1 Tax=Embleya sp. NPDC127516 TaxID=3363990 RepID=UPI0037F95EE9
MTFDHAIHLPILRGGLRWLYETRQPRRALVEQHGATLRGPAGSNRLISWVPVGADGTPVVILGVARVDHDPERGPTVLAPGELDALVGALRDLGADPVERWHGHTGAGTTGSVRLARRAHRTLLAAVDRYRAGCPRHPARYDDWDCTWFARGRARLKDPRPVLDHDSLADFIADGW